MAGGQARVFPTHVGVFPFLGRSSDTLACLPHACGGVSIWGSTKDMAMLSSPRMWGCFRSAFQTCQNVFVFPTHVGVFLPLLPESGRTSRLPHACGGVSPTDHSPSNPTESSPRMWGCFIPIAPPLFFERSSPRMWGCFFLALLLIPTM